MLGIIGRTVKDVANISVLILLLLFCYLLIGMELYAHKLPKINEEELLMHGHQTNFNSFLEAFISVFIVLSNDGWTRIYISHYRYTDSPFSSTFYFFSLLIFGQFILLNLFVSVLINNFEEVSVRNDLIQKLTDLKKDSSFQRIQAWIQRYIMCKKQT